MTNEELKRKLEIRCIHLRNRTSRATPQTTLEELWPIIEAELVGRQEDQHRWTEAVRQQIKEIQAELEAKVTASWLEDQAPS